MDEIKNPRKPLIYYYVIAMLVLMLFNLLAKPWIMRAQIDEVDYGTFIRMTEEKKIGKVNIEENQILFTDAEGKKVYRTGPMEDPGRTERLYQSGAKFSSEIVEQASPIVSMLLSWVVPLLLFWGLGQYMQKKLMNRMEIGRASCRERV